MSVIVDIAAGVEHDVDCPPVRPMVGVVPADMWENPGSRETTVTSRRAPGDAPSVRRIHHRVAGDAAPQGEEFRRAMQESMDLRDQGHS